MAKRKERKNLCINRKPHRWQAGHHRLICARCGRQEPAETCATSTQLPEPAGWRALLCGCFTHREQANAKRLWDELRLSMAYQPWGEEAMTQPYPPGWFLREWMPKPNKN
jgi:hypothetical protein